MTDPRRRLRSLLASLLLVVTAEAAGATTYYVRTSGDDASSGLSPASAWATVDHAAEIAVAGDTVYVGAGTYTDRADFKNSGTAASPIIFVADLAGSFTGDAGEVVIAPGGGEAVKIDNEDHIQLIGFRVRGDKKGFKIKNAIGIRIEDCIADGSDDHGFEIDDAEVTIVGCEVYGHGKEGISIKHDGTMAVFSELIVRDNGEQGIKIEKGSVELRRCHVHGNAEDGIEVRDATVTIANCVIYENASHAIETRHHGANVEIWHATVARNEGSGLHLDKGSVTLRNSIVAFNDGNGLLRDDASFVHDYNVVHANAAGNYSGTSAAPSEIDLDPQFVGTTDFHLTPASPAIDAGVDASAVTNVDREGVARPQGLSWDLGAYEVDLVIHFEIVHDGSAVNCQAERVTIRVHDQTHALVSFYNRSITLSTSTGHGDWSLLAGLGSFSNAGGGTATYGFSPGDGGEAVFALRNSFSETVDIDVADGAASEDPAEDPPLTFAAAGFEFLADGVASAIGTQIAGKPSDVAPGAQSLELRAIRTSDQTGACEAALQGPTQVELAFTCEDPSSCFGPQVIVNGASPIPGSGGPTPGAWTPVALDFGGPTDGTAPITLRWSDAGRIRVHARRALAPSDELLEGASNAFAVRPFALRVSADGNPGASDGGGPIFTQAGRDFVARAAAVAWQAADDADVDGIADGHADLDPTTGVDLSDNALLPAFGREVAPEVVRLASSLIAPAGGSDPGLQGGTLLSGFVSGEASSANVHFDEVGVIEMRAAVSDGDWLGIGAAETAKIAGRSGFVGRFNPSYLDVVEDTAPAWATFCASGGFTYVGQPFLYATAPVLGVTARSFLGTQTRNYTGAPPAGFFQLTNAGLGSPVYASDPGAPAPLDTGGLPPAGSDPAILDLGDGTATLTFDAGSGLLFTKASPVAPFDAELSLSLSVVDTDGVAWPSNPWRFGDATPGNGMAWSAGKAQRYGRLRLVGAFGSELSPLPEPLRAEYWTGAGFALHGDDGCTVIPVASVGTTARGPATLATTPSIGNAPLLSGDAGLVWSAPGQPGTADAIVNLGGAPLATPFGPLAGAALPWLRYDWTTDGVGPPIEDPSARLTFGIFGGEASVIFRREVY